MAPIVISIEGGIAIGKSTLCEKLEECGYKVFKEGLDEWGNVLDLFYKDPKRNCYLLQTAILMNMHNQKLFINHQAMKTSEIDSYLNPKMKSFEYSICKA